MGTLFDLEFDQFADEQGGAAARLRKARYLAAMVELRDQEGMSTVLAGLSSPGGGVAVEAASQEDGTSAPTESSVWLEAGRKLAAASFADFADPLFAAEVTELNAVLFLRETATLEAIAAGAASMGQNRGAASPPAVAPAANGIPQSQGVPPLVPPQAPTPPDLPLGELPSGGDFSALTLLEDENHPPVAANDSGSGLEDTPITVNVVANDSDPDGNHVFVTAFALIPGQPLHGEITFTATSVTFTPEANWSGSTSFYYQIKDGHFNTDGVPDRVGEAWGTVSVTVNAVNDFPQARQDLATTAQATPVTINVLANDSDAEGAVMLISVDSTSWGEGEIENNYDGTVTYTPAHSHGSGGEVTGFTGFDLFAYRIMDQTGNMANGSVKVYVSDPEEDDAPWPRNDQATANEDTPLVIAVLANDYDAEGPLVLDSVDAASAGGGVVVNNLDGSVTYTPPQDFSGDDYFCYVVRDNGEQLAGAYVTLQVLPANDAPEAVDDVGYVLREESLSIFVVGNDWDVDNIDAVEPQDLIVTDVTQPAWGSVWFDDESVTYIANESFPGEEDVFQYTLLDGHGAAATATVTISDPRVNLRIHDGLKGSAVPDPVEMTRGAFTVANLNDTDADGVKDSQDQSVLRTVPNRGEDEKDLMELRVFIPATDREGSVTLDVPPSVRLWKLSYKDTECPKAGGVYSIPAEQFSPYSANAYYYWAYVEATAASPLDPRDIVITADYRGTQDSVAATAVWVDIPPTQGASVEDSTKSAQQVLSEFPWSTMPDDVKGYVTQEDGTGLLPWNPAPLGGMQNGIVMQFQVNPYRIVYEPERIVFFDITQRVECNYWILREDGSERKFRTTRWSANPDLSNDDVIGDPPYPESNEPDQPGRMFFYDAPGYLNLGIEPTDGRYVSRANFETFVRVSVGSDVNGNGLLGTRASDKFLWHSRDEWVKIDAGLGLWDRTSWIENDRNDIGQVPTPHISLGSTWQ